MTGVADVHKLLDRLDKVKTNGTDRWTACCPAHDDKGPSLAVRLADDGKLLIHCFAGCGAANVLAAVGMEMHELFPKRPDDFRSKPTSPSQRWVPRDVLSCVAREALVVVFAAEAVHKGQSLSTDDLERLAVAAGRLRAAAKEVGYDG